MNTGLKVWLWIVFVINIISGVMMIPLMLIQPLLIVSLIAEVLIIVGAGLILFSSYATIITYFLFSSIGLKSYKLQENRIHISMNPIPIISNSVVNQKLF